MIVFICNIIINCIIKLMVLNISCVYLICKIIFYIIFLRVKIECINIYGWKWVNEWMIRLNCLLNCLKLVVKKEVFW